MLNTQKSHKFPNYNAAELKPPLQHVQCKQLIYSEKSSGQYGQENIFCKQKLQYIHINMITGPYLLYISPSFE